MRHVIIGNGTAGIHAAETIRSLDSEASITIIAGETFPPYCRPMISLFLEGVVSRNQLRIRPPDYYDSLRITPLSGEWVRNIDVKLRRVLTDRGREVPFDRLLIASGADPRPIRAQGSHLKNVSFLRSESHVRDMMDALPYVKRVLVLGGGLVGFKAAYGFLRRKIPVTMLIRSSYPLSMQVDPFAGELLRRELQNNGLDVRVGVEAVAFEGGDRVREVHLSDGSSLKCDLVVIGKGVTPAVSFVPADRIQMDLGILVNQRMETTEPGIYAAGDVAEHFDVARNTRWVNALWPVAVEQGRIAGANMAGRTVNYAGSLSRNVIRVFGLDVLTGGLVNPPREDGYEEIASYDAYRRRYRRLVFRDDVPVGLVMVNYIEQGGVFLSLLQQQRPVGGVRNRLLHPSFNVSQLLH